MNELRLWIPAIVAIVSGICAIAGSFAVVRSQIATFLEEKREMKAHTEVVTKDLQNLIATFTGFTREQNVINQFTATTLTALVKRIEDQDKRINEQNATIQVLMALIKRLDKANME